MRSYLIPGLCGLFTGLLLHWGRLSQGDELRAAMGLRRSLTLRTCLTALGWGMMLTSLLLWLAVLDTAARPAIPLTLGTLLGGALFGLCAALGGFTPTTAFAGVGSGQPLEALCTLAGCFAGTALIPWLRFPEAAAEAAAPLPFSLLACGGALLAVIALCILSPRVILLTEEDITARAAANAPAPEPDAAAEETVIAALEGEEPLIVDTALGDAADDEASQEEDA